MVDAIRVGAEKADLKRQQPTRLNQSCVTGQQNTRYQEQNVAERAIGNVKAEKGCPGDSSDGPSDFANTG